ncbi:MAG: restriction endonuclease [Deltaproteobacteria bacterium]|uniref:restriction endonuclease subunit S n=1 Tax=Hydrosulfovibrio ferrireducens TaxID=2934181 RepID=UPI001222BE37|nr:MAG: restriction endonuclease [Deltaproteobacteria bacterium]
MKTTYPQSWAVQKLGDVMDVQGGSQPPKSEFIYEPHGDFVQLLQIRDFGEKTVPTYVPKNKVTKFCTKDDVLIARYGASLGRILTGLEGAYNVALAKTIFDKRLFFNKYLFYLLKTSVLQSPLKMISRSAQNGFAKHEIAHAQLPIPPLNEQHRIVAKIEELFSELDKGIENLKTAQAQLKVYRQALLKHAFEGKLTAQWRAENSVIPAQAGIHSNEKLDSRLRGNDSMGGGNDRRVETAEALLKRIQQERGQRFQQQLADWEAAGKQGSKPKAPKPLEPLTAEELDELPELPEGWGWEKLGNIAELIGGVTKGKNLDGKEKISLPYLRVANVQDGYLDLTEIKNIEVETRDKDKYLLEFGDVLYTEGGDKDKLGRGAVWRSQIEACIHQNHIFRARVFGGVIIPEILSLYSQTKSAKKYFFRHAKQTTNLASINLTVLANLPVVIVCQSEQKQILLEIEARLSEVDQLDQTITTSLQQAEALRQSILKKAFSGQLVEQDPHDEPASALLARIKAERAVGAKNAHTAAKSHKTAGRK